MNLSLEDVMFDQFDLLIFYVDLHISASQNLFFFLDDDKIYFYSFQARCSFLEPNLISSLTYFIYPMFQYQRLVKALVIKLVYFWCICRHFSLPHCSLCNMRKHWYDL